MREKNEKKMKNQNENQKKIKVEFIQREGMFIQSERKQIAIGKQNRGQ
jgi:hypothetical protein